MSSHLQDAIDNNSEYGICSAVTFDFRAGILNKCPSLVNDFVVQYCKTKGWWSGHYSYPIANPGNDDPDESFWLTNNMFDPDTEYGLRRIEIAKAVLKEFYNE